MNLVNETDANNYEKAGIKLTYIVLYKNFPINTLNKQIHFTSNKIRDEAFDSGRWEQKIWAKPFNMVRDRLKINLDGSLQDFRGYNYGSFIDHRSGIRYYFQIAQLSYINEEVTELIMIIDTIMTFCQGKVLANIKNVLVTRQHLPSGQYEDRLQYLRTNDDILKTSTKRYVAQKKHQWSTYHVIFQCSMDLSAEWGTEDRPNNVMASGTTFDSLTSPVNLYATSYATFNSVMAEISKAPWIAQNITQVMMIPDELMKSAQLVASKLNGKDNANLKKLKANGHSEDGAVSFKYTIDEMLSACGIATDELHLFRSEYVTIEGYDYAGQSLTFNPAFLDSANGLTFKTLTSVGYFNQIAIYPWQYQTSSEKAEGNWQTGAFLNNAFIYNNWNELPVLIDNYKLSMAKSSNVRQLGEDRQISGRIRNIADPKGFTSLEGIASKFNDAYAITGGGLNIASVMGKMHDEYEFYRDQKAQFADLKLSTPSISAQTNGASFQIANNIFGFVIKLSAPNKSELDKVRKYYNTFGYEFNEVMGVYNPESMTICNYLQFSGNWKINNVPADLMSQMKSLFELGVQLWHDDGTINPMEQNILNNKRN